MSKIKKILISGGGTGGHIYPAIAIANELKLRYADAEFLFVGAQDKMEMEKVPHAGYPIKGLWIAGLQRSLTFKNMLFPIKLINSIWRSKKIVRQFKPDVVIGTGGFASGPVLHVASKKGVPCLIQEQNSHAGITNKILSKKVNKVCVAYENMQRYFPSDKIVFTGNPVRQDLLNVSSKRAEAQVFFKLDPNKKTLLVLGGSLGARAINQMIENNVKGLLAQQIQIIWQTGKFYIKEYKKFGELEGVQTHAYLSKMDLAYAAADIIVSRAGASSVSELCIVGKPVIFMPSPNVAEDHQTKNAMAIVNKNAAIMLKETEKEYLMTKVQYLLQNEDNVNQMCHNMKALARPEATKRIVEEIEKIAKWN
ncbi:undecaprenyldiphospho-muramoylpentapeptide beta-N-acetylglucosaminyltransferase [Wenyingzhuangia marina]|uniref:UDP-N-acetylglucosamine--N-acetylmuramyl-(pentapeptide) pyrophosphoryl-undecaprenol N-acetylglucosamine transferase n=1 Tax=Wenyingzhuangia marina TaxID=1195760 RepID=A0A1M5SG42_9FLAO|nr:undecaprenyldiphospho-muramoylpentapeptide beta-N-acetylglucosaminyltransferase [Wenyingzhuangia marina]GGF62084.1 UDP-N-acetylglucosamine--N-acetylmuramyl-(pentapeptide) pyrophosphoryl-undecaprenol N-acetylglucosamine transferase [Wenyingzhuangia marina]SHH37435.1 UDP-N-acetylglucosamine-N-acetylmuramylpentapeptide N-acetylglucosamine transferase [Wenyingzhuangia marina]